MSEYQSFEFQAIDRLLTNEEMDALRRCSSRAEITPMRFWNEYHWGQFKGHPRRWMEHYFDAFLHVANWGTHWLMLRLPLGLMGLSEVEAYRVADGDGLFEDGLEAWQTAEHLVLSFRSETEEPDWEEGSGWLASLIGVRTSLTRGDRRSLYLGWLAQVGAGYVDAASIEPPVPPGLGELDATHRALADFLRIPNDLLMAAASSAPLQAQGIDAADIARWVAQRPVSENEALLTALIAGDEPNRALVIRKQIERELSPPVPEGDADERRAVGELLADAEALTRERQAQEAAETAAMRERYLASLRTREAELWQEVEELIDRRQPSTYDAAVDRLKDLRDLAEADGTREAFSARLRQLRQTHARKSTLLRRLDLARLVS
jgi:hypothetical protein